VGIPSTSMSVLDAASAPGTPLIEMSEGIPSPMAAERRGWTLVWVASRSSMVFAGDALISVFVMTLTLAGVSLIRRFDREAVTTIGSTEAIVSALFFLETESGTAENGAVVRSSNTIHNF
jgi:hypothetical protein